MQGAHDVRFGASVAAGELQQWQSSKSVLVGIGQDFDRVVIRAPPHGFLGSRPSQTCPAPSRGGLPAIPEMSPASSRRQVLPPLLGH